MVSRDPKVPLVVRPFGRAEAARLRAVTAHALLELAKPVHGLSGMMSSTECGVARPDPFSGP